MLTLKQMEEIKELSIPSVVLSAKKSVLLLIGKAKYKLFSEDNGVRLGCKIFRLTTVSGRTA